MACFHCLASCPMLHRRADAEMYDTQSAPSQVNLPDQTGGCFIDCIFAPLSPRLYGGRTAQQGAARHIHTETEPDHRPHIPQAALARTWRKGGQSVSAAHRRSGNRVVSAQIPFVSMFVIPKSLQGRPEMSMLIRV